MAAQARQRFLQFWGPILFGNDKIAVIHFLQGRGLVAVVKHCPVCNGQIRLEPHQACQDGYRWYGYL